MRGVLARNEVRVCLGLHNLRRQTVCISRNKRIRVHGTLPLIGGHLDMQLNMQLGTLQIRKIVSVGLDLQ